MPLSFGRTLINRGAPFPIYQANLGAQYNSQAPALLLQQQVPGALLFPKKETGREHTHFSSTCFLHVLLKTPVLKGMCSRRQVSTNTCPRPACPSPSTTSLRRSPLPFPAFPFIKTIFLEYVCVKFFKEESSAHKAPVAFNCRFKI